MGGISRGWWRLSLVVGLCSLFCLLALIWDDVRELDAWTWIRITGTFGIFPAVTVILIGWVVAGFRAR